MVGQPLAADRIEATHRASVHPPTAPPGNEQRHTDKDRHGDGQERKLEIVEHGLPGKRGWR